MFDHTRVRPAAASHPSASPPTRLRARTRADQVLALQRAAGNRAVARVLAEGVDEKAVVVRGVKEFNAPENVATHVVEVLKAASRRYEEMEVLGHIALWGMRHGVALEVEKALA